MNSGLPYILTPKDISAILGISKNSTYALMHRRDFPAFQIGKQYRVKRDRFVEWIDKVDMEERKNGSNN